MALVLALVLAGILAAAAWGQSSETYRYRYYNHKPIDPDTGAVTNTDENSNFAVIGNSSNLVLQANRYLYGEYFFADGINADDLAAGAATARTVAEGAVTSAKLGSAADGSIIASLFANDSIDGTELQRLTSSTLSEESITTPTVTSSHFMSNSLETSDLAPQSVSNNFLAKLGSGVTINLAGISNKSLLSRHLADNVINLQVHSARLRSNAIADNAIGPAQVEAGAIQGGSIVTNALTGQKFVAKSFEARHFREVAYTSADRIADGSLTMQQFEVTAGATDSLHELLTSSNLASVFAIDSDDDVIGTNVVTATQLADTAVTAAKISSGSVTGSAFAAGTLGTTHLGTLELTAAHLASTFTLPTTRVASGIDGALKLEAGTVTSSQLASGAVAAGHLAAGAITASKLADASVTAAAVADGSLAFDRFSQTLQTTVMARLAAVSEVPVVVEAGSLMQSHLAAGAVQGRHFAPGVVTAAKVGSGLTGELIAANSLNAAFVEAGAIQGCLPSGGGGGGASGYFSDGTCLSGQRGALSYNALNDAHLRDQTLTTADFTVAGLRGPAFSGVNGAAILPDNAILTLKLTLGSVGGSQLGDGAVTASKLQASSVNGQAHLQDGTVTGTHIAAGGISAVKLADGAITDAAWSAGSLSASQLPTLGFADLSAAAQLAVNTKGAVLSITADSVANDSINSATIEAEGIERQALNPQVQRYLERLDALEASSQSKDRSQSLVGTAITTAASNASAGGQVTAQSVTFAQQARDRFFNNGETLAAILDGQSLESQIAGDDSATVALRQSLESALNPSVWVQQEVGLRTDRLTIPAAAGTGGSGAGATQTITGALVHTTAVTAQQFGSANLRSQLNYLREAVGVPNSEGGFDPGSILGQLATLDAQGLGNLADQTSAVDRRIGEFYALATALRQPQLPADNALVFGFYFAAVQGTAGYALGASYGLADLIQLPGSLSLSVGTAGSEFAFKVGLGYRF